MKNKNMTTSITSHYFSTFIKAINCTKSDLQKLLESCNINPSSLDNPDHQIEARNIIHFLEAARKLTKNNLIGLNAGAFAHPSDWGILSFAMLASTTTGEAFSNIIEFEDIVNSSLITQTDILNDHQIRHTVSIINVDNHELAKPLIERDLYAMLKCFDFLTNSPGKSKQYIYEAHFKHKKPESDEELEAYRHAFGDKIIFSSDTNCLIYNPEALTLNVKTHQRDLIPVIMNSIKNIHKQRVNKQPDIIGKVSIEIKNNLIKGTANKQKIAQGLGMSLSTLQRNLAKHKTSYQEIFDHVREDLAKELLKRDQMELIDIAFLLGFSSASSFTSAFKKWTNQTPSQYRILEKK